MSKYAIKENVNGKIITHAVYDTRLQADSAIGWDEAINGLGSPLYVDKVQDEEAE